MPALLRLVGPYPERCRSAVRAAASAARTAAGSAPTAAATERDTLSSIVVGQRRQAVPHVLPDRDGALLSTSAVPPVDGSQ